MDFHVVELLYLYNTVFFYLVSEGNSIHEATLRVVTQRTHGRRQSWPRRMASMVGSFLGSGPGGCGTKRYKSPGSKMYGTARKKVGLYRAQDSQ